jgi:hypothetical protein
MTDPKKNQIMDFCIILLNDNVLVKSIQMAKLKVPPIP